MATSTIPQLEFSCKQPKAGSPDNPTLVTPDRSFVRKFFSDQLPLPDGDTEIWGFEDDTLGRVWPSRLIRATEGEVVQVEIKPAKRVHTIHHHGIEPEPINDGVGHTSAEITGHFTYQWRAHSPGTYFYHCHVNTTLHVQMGMYGALVIDPKRDASLKPGETRAFANGPVYEVEAIWAFGAIDPRWHNLNHAAGLCSTEDAANARLNDFRPRYVLINGSVQPFDLAAFITSPDVAITAKSGQPILIRAINGTYIPQVVVFRPDIHNPNHTLRPQLIASDGRPFLDPTGHPLPIDVPKQNSNPLNPHAGLKAFIISSAERYDVLLNTATDPAPPGVYRVDVEFRQWRHPHPPIKEQPIFAPVDTARTTITIT
jgi:FtsP/CotA-like multicopper oxidase with cupredoxin domain